MAGPPVEDAESSDLDSARTGNWRYVGGPVLGSVGMVTDRGITVGLAAPVGRRRVRRGRRTGDPILAPGFRIGFDGTDQVTWLGDVQCGP